MQDLTRAEYLSALRDHYRIVRPAASQMLAVCPHLTEEQVLEVLTSSGTCSVALPPVLVRGSFQSTLFYPGNPDREMHSSFTVKRSIGSSTHYRFKDEAWAYAEEHWPEKLVACNWIDALGINLSDPAVLREGAHGGPSFIRGITIGLNHSWSEIFRSGASYGELDEAIAIATLNGFESSEIAAFGSVDYRSCCSRCGGGLGVNICHGCGRRYPISGFCSVDVGWDTPLPPKLVELLRGAGHVFEQEPERLYEHASAAK
jgi:hypothetical protein